MVNIKGVIPEYEPNEVESVVILNNNQIIPIINDIQQQSVSKQSMADEIVMKNIYDERDTKIKYKNMIIGEDIRWKE